MAEKKVATEEVEVKKTTAKKTAVKKESSDEKVAKKTTTKKATVKEIVSEEKPVKKTTTKKVTVEETVSEEKPAKKTTTKKVAEKEEKPAKVTKTAKEEKPAKAVKETKTEKADKKVAEKKTTTKKTSVKKVSSSVQYLGTGRRKKAIARVRLIPGGDGTIVINKQPIDEYFEQETMKLILRQPLVLTGSERKFDVYVNVIGGGISGQAGAICHGISRALVKADETYKADLKKAGFLTRDSRMKERKKYGLKKARKAPTYTKGGGK